MFILGWQLGGSLVMLLTPEDAMHRDPCPNTLASFAVLLPALLACQSPESPPISFGGLDTDGDGALRPQDLDSGSAGVYLWRSDGDGEELEEAHLSVEAELLYDGAAQRWIFRAPLQGVPEYVLHMPFDPESGEQGPALGASELLGVSIDVPAREQGGRVEPGGEFNVTESGQSASGWVELDALILMESYVQQTQTGEALRVAGVAFSDIEVSR